MEECPVCEMEIDFEPKDGLYDKVNCPRCGKFSISYEALTILGNEKIKHNKYWIISYWIRNHQKKDEFF